MLEGEEAGDGRLDRLAGEPTALVAACLLESSAPLHFDESELGLGRRARENAVMCLCWHARRQRDRRTDGQTDRRTDGQTDRQTERERERETEREREREREREINTHTHTQALSWLSSS